MHIEMVVILGAAAAAGYLLQKYEARILGSFRSYSADGSAFAKAAEADAKIAQLKVLAEAKKSEAEAVHASFDEVHKLLGVK